MSTKKTDLPKDHEKPQFDPTDFLPDDDDDLDLDGLDLGNELSEGEGEEIPDHLSDEPEDEEPELKEPEEPEEPEEAEEPEEPEAEEAEEPQEPQEPEEPEETEEPEPEPEDKPRGKKQHMIPKGRLDHQIAKTRQLEQELDRLRKEAAQAQRDAAEKAKVPDEDIQGWLKDASQKAIDGELDEAAALQKRAFDAMAQNRGEVRVDQQPMNPDDLVAQIEERVELKHTVKQIFADFPMLNPDNEGFDEGLNEEALEFQDFYLTKGYTPAVAVEKAVEALSKLHDLQPASYQPPVEKAKKPERDVTVQVDKKMKAAKSQPPEPAGRKGNKAAPEDTVDINALDDEAWMALPESVRASLRGDA